MTRHSYNVIGVMSGTSLDGVDIAHINFNFTSGTIDYQLFEAATVAYPPAWVDKLKKAVNFSAEELHQLNEDYTYLLGSFINKFIRENNIVKVDAVCSHGHTILHQPHNKLTLQIGNLPFLATIINNKVVCDFRVQDVAMGGQGAPLVPVGDSLLFKEYGCCVNLGGFSNISFESGNGRLAFDICAVNTVLNHYAGMLGLEYDDKGKIAAGGNINPSLLNELNNLPFYMLPYPKSLGFEYVKTTIIPLIENYHITIQDKLATYTEHVAFQLASNINKGPVLITGGGAYNETLVKRVKELLPGIKIVLPDDKTIQYKEALIFGLLGVLKLRDEINVFASVTGAPADHCAGFIYKPK